MELKRADTSEYSYDGLIAKINGGMKIKKVSINSLVNGGEKLWEAIDDSGQSMDFIRALENYNGGQLGKKLENAYDYAVSRVNVMLSSFRMPFWYERDIKGNDPRFIRKL